ncbi:MAG: ribonuclease D [Sumerlaeia bacterium]
MTVDYRLIEDQESLNAFCERLMRESVLYIDTEFVGEKYYYPRLELIQIGNGKTHIGLIDVRKILDSKPLAELLNRDGLLKVFHSASQDLMLLDRYLGKLTAPIFDTQLAAAMVGVGAQISFANLVKMYTDEVIPKQHTVSDWSKRPLSTAQLDYAAKDVYYLPILHDRLSQKLAKLSREEWFYEEQQKKFHESLELSVVDESMLFKSVKEWGKVQGVRLAVLQELALWREKTAQRIDSPKRQIMSDAGLIALSQLLPKSASEARSVRQVPAGPLNQFLNDILEIINATRNLPKEAWPKRPPSTPLETPAGFMELLQALIRTIGDDQSIASNLLATSAELNQIVLNRHHLKEEDYPLFQGWRKTMAGDKVLALLNGNLRLKIEDRESLRFY